MIPFSTLQSRIPRFWGNFPSFLGNFSQESHVFLLYILNIQEVFFIEIYYASIDLKDKKLLELTGVIFVDHIPLLYPFSLYKITQKKPPRERGRFFKILYRRGINYTDLLMLTHSP